MDGDLFSYDTTINISESNSLTETRLTLRNRLVLVDILYKAYIYDTGTRSCIMPDSSVALSHELPVPADCRDARLFQCSTCGEKNAVEERSNGENSSDYSACGCQEVRK